MTDLAEQIYSGEADMREPKPSRLALIPFEQVLLDTAPAYLVKGIVPVEGLTIIWGPPKCGKSFWAFDLVMHVVLGRPYRGRRVLQGPVVYVACEGGRGFKARIEAYRQRFLDNDEDPPFYLVTSRLDLITDHEELANEIRRTLGDIRPVAVVLDTLNRSMSGSENSDEDMSAYIEAADALREGFTCGVIVVHHCGTEGTRPRGHTSLTGAVDAQLAVKRDAAGLFTVTVECMKDGPEGDQISGRLEVVEVGTDDDGDPITSCVVVPVETTTKAEKPLTGHAKTAHEALIAVVYERHEYVANDPKSGHLPDVSVEVWKAEFCARCIDGRDTKRDTLKKRFRRAAEELQRRSFVGIRDGRAWLNRKAGHGGT